VEIKVTFEDTPLISSAAIVRRAGATPYHGRKVIARLVTDGQIKPVITGTHREILTPRDSEILFNRLVNGH
jgi:hypothetical protein